MDRVYRIGQTRPVTVKVLIMKDSIEERILALQEAKTAIAAGALGQKGGAGGRTSMLASLLA